MQANRTLPITLVQSKLRERAFFCTLWVLLAVAVAGRFAFPLTPEVVQKLLHDLGMHAHTGANVFADTRHWLGVPNAADVLSNLPFAVFGAWGLHAMRAQPKHPQRIALLVFFGGLLLTTAGSVLYHLSPSNDTLLWDRIGMMFAFAGVLSVAVGQRISLLAGGKALWLTLLGAVLALWVWERTGDVLAWSVVQFGGMALIAVCATLSPRQHSANRVSLLALIGFYAVAKVFESADLTVFQATGQWVSGHTLKHLAASCAALPVLMSLRKSKV